MFDSEIPSVLSLMRLNEAYLRVVNEDAEGKNINRAEKYVKQNHPKILGSRLQNGVEMTPRVFTQEVRNLMPNVRGANCKFLLGASRIYFDDLSENPSELQRKASSLNKILKFVTSDAHVNEYDHDLNGMSLKELEDRFGGAVSKGLKDDMANVSAKHRTKNEDYEIVKIPDFKTASKYGQYTSWCVTHDEGMFDNYTSGSIGLFYFCLRKGYQTVPKEKGEGCPLDDYGKSMIAVSVNDDGSLNTCTCRWNHDNGGNDGIMTTEQISDLLGVDFYKTFKPRDPNGLLGEYRKKAVKDDFADKMGWVAFKDDEECTYYASIERDGGSSPRLVKRRFVFRGMTSDVRDSVCVATDSFHWYDGMTGDAIKTPDVVYGDIVCTEWSALTSLEGCPKEIEGFLDVSFCTNLKRIDVLPEVGDEIRLYECPLSDASVKVLAGNANFLKDALGLRSSDVVRDGKGGLSVVVDMDFDYLCHIVPLRFQKLLVEAYGGKWAVPQGIAYDLMDYLDPEPFDSVMRKHGIDGVNWEDALRTPSKYHGSVGQALDEYNYDGRPLWSVLWNIFKKPVCVAMRKAVDERVFPKLFIDVRRGIFNKDGGYVVHVVIPSEKLVGVVRAVINKGDGFLMDTLVSNAKSEDPRIFAIPREVIEILTSKSPLTDKWNAVFKDFAEYVASKAVGRKR